MHEDNWWINVKLNYLKKQTLCKKNSLKHLSNKHLNLKNRSWISDFITMHNLHTHTYTQNEAHAHIYVVCSHESEEKNNLCYLSFNALCNIFLSKRAKNKYNILKTFRFL